MVSVIVPAYNCESCLERCVNSIRKQTYSDLEIILVNDGSTDRTGEMCDAFAAKDERIIVIHTENQGPSRTRTTGMNAAAGKYIQFVDSDDWIEPDMTESLVEAIEKNSVQMAICGYDVVRNVNGGLRIPGHNAKCPVGRMDIEIKELYDYFLNALWNKLYIREQITADFPENISMGEDLIFNIDYLSHVQSVTVVDRALYHYICENQQSLSRKRKPGYLENQKNLFYRTLKFCEEYMESGDGIGQICTCYMTNVLLEFGRVCNDPHISQKEKKNVIKTWLADESVQYAAARSCSYTKARKVRIKLVQLKWCWMLALTFKLKK